MPRNDRVIVRNPYAPAASQRRRILIGTTAGDRTLTLVIEQTLELSTWLVVTGWIATAAERKLLARKR